MGSQARAGGPVAGGTGGCRSPPGPGSAPCFERLLRMSGSWVEAGSEPSEFV